MNPTDNTTDIMTWRERDVEKLFHILITPLWRLVTIYGEPGMGKTNVALRVANKMKSERFVTRVCILNASPNTMDDTLQGKLALCIRVAIRNCTADNVIESRVANAIGCYLEQAIDKLILLPGEPESTLLVLDDADYLRKFVPTITAGVLGYALRKYHWLNVLVTSTQRLLPKIALLGVVERPYQLTHDLNKEDTD